ncbi:hypothetical protein BMUNKI379_06070, partial [Burkholderia multivorans]
MKSDGASAGDTGVTVAGADVVPAPDDATAGGVAVPADADAGAGTTAGLLAGCARPLTIRRTSRSAPVGGALTTLGR